AVIGVDHADTGGHPCRALPPADDGDLTGGDAAGRCVELVRRVPEVAEPLLPRGDDLFRGGPGDPHLVGLLPELPEALERADRPATLHVPGGGALGRLVDTEHIHRLGPVLCVDRFRHCRPFDGADAVVRPFRDRYDRIQTPADSGCMVSVTASRQPAATSSGSTRFRRDLAKASVTFHASYRARLNRRSIAACTRRRSGLNRAATARVEAAMARSESDGAIEPITVTRPTNTRPSRPTTNK